MKVLMVIDSIVKGGKERRMLELIKGLVQQPGMDIYLVSLTDVVEYEYVYDLPIQFEVLKRKYKKDLSIVPKLKKIIRAFQPDIIHSWSTMASVYLSVANLFSRVPLINGVLADAQHGLGLSDKHYLRVKLTTPFSKAIVSNSLAGIRAYRTPAGKSVCIYNGIDFSRFEQLRPPAEVATELWGRPKNDEQVVAMVAAFDARKDYESLVQVAIRLCEHNAQLIFLLIGSGVTLEGLQARVPEKLAAQILFTGKKSNVESILQLIDIGVLISNPKVHGEGISNSIIEYMAVGKPVIATNDGGTPEVIRDGVNGFLIEANDEGQLQEKISFLLSHPDHARAMGAAGFTDVRRQFDVQAKTREYLDLYQQYAKQKKSATTH